ncbi:MAG TPA: L,D-transpeptidase family protein [Pseudolabrys sp.]|nr:L,D-transpeptidase family protein [Pseudolabrys sp.]
MKRVRIDRLAASTALGLILVLASQGSHAQQAPEQLSEQINAAVPMPDTDQLPPPTAKDIGVAEPLNVEPTAEPKQDAAAPAAEPAKAAAAPVAAPPPPSADAAVADKLRELVGGRLDRYVARKPDRAGVETYYKAHDYKPLWITDGAANARAKAAIAFLAQVDSVGLNPSDYVTPDFSAATTPDAQAEAELRLTDAVLTYARHAQIGRISFTRVAADIQFEVVAPEPASVLAKLAEDSDTAAALDSYNPPQAGFKALKEKLAELRNKGTVAEKHEQKTEQQRVHVPEGKILRPGMKDARVVALRKRLDVAGDKDSPLYDDAVRDAVKTFQTESDIAVDGNLGPATTRALNGEKKETRRASADPVDTILVNMERWRWLPRKLGNASDTYVVVNVPDYSLSLTHNGKLFWKTKIVVGKPGKATPMTTAEMKFITVNPTWNVPPSIIENEYLPALREDPQALDRIGLKVKQDPDGTVHIFQPPGAGNALGRIRFNFPNKFLVYQHDTPDKYLFAKEKRAYSHGCMRVQDPLVYATKLLSIEAPDQHYTPEKLERMFGGSEININFPHPIPVHLTYQTAFVDEAGKLQIREDVYGRDARMIAILKNNAERKVADIAVERHADASSRPVKLAPGSLGGDRDYRSNGPNFFGWIFGGPRTEMAPPPRARSHRYNERRTTNERGFFWR